MSNFMILRTGTLLYAVVNDKPFVCMQTFSGLVNTAYLRKYIYLC